MACFAGGTSLHRPLFPSDEATSSGYDGSLENVLEVRRVETVQLL